MRFHLPLCAALLALAMSAAAAETALTVRSTELKKEPFIDAATVATLAEQEKVEIIKRQGAWTQVKTAAAQGWVRMLSLRLGEGTAKKGDSGIGSLLNVARTGSSGNTVSTGVRGLSEEDLKNTQPNPEELQKMERLAASAQEARSFAGSARLGSRQVDYLAPPSAAAADGKSSWGGGQ